MHETAQKLIQTFPDHQRLLTFADRLLGWLNQDLNESGEPFSESRARALLLAGEVLDDPTRNSFIQLMENETPVSIALYDLLRETGLAEHDDIRVLVMTLAQTAAPTNTKFTDWLALAVAGHAWKSGFQLDRLDPAYPPEPYSPAGQVLKRAAFFARQQVTRSATERDKLGRKLAHNPAAAGTATLDTLQAGSAIAPVPPHYRMPVPVRYPEYTPGVEVKPEEVGQPPATRDGSINLSHDDITPTTTPTTQPLIRIDPEQIDATPEPPTASRLPTRSGNVVMPNATATVNTGSGRTTGERERGRGRTSLKTTKLRVVVQEYPDGPGLYGLQVKVSSRSIRRSVAGTTNRDGEFTCELPVQVDTGLTYDIDVTWPRDFGGDTERKSLTLNADRTHFILPFYRKLKA